MTKHDAAKAYFEPKVIELVDKNIQFNFSPEAPDNISFITRYSDNVVRSFVCGDKEKEYGFAIIIVKQYSTESDDLNLEAMNLAQAFMDWIEEQNENRDFPDFGKNCEVLKIENLQNMPNLSGINQKESLARYMIQGRILYREYGE